MNPRSPRRSSAATEMKSVDLSDHTPNHCISTTTTHEYPSPNNSGVAFSASPTSIPPTTAPSSFSSLISSSPLSGRLSFQTLSNFIPTSWTPKSDVPRSSLSSVDVIAAPAAIDISAKHNYVSKEKQLAKLRCRLEREGTLRTGTLIDVCCRNCADETVFL